MAEIGERAGAAGAAGTVKALDSPDCRARARAVHRRDLVIVGDAAADRAVAVRGEGGAADCDSPLAARAGAAVDVVAGSRTAGRAQLKLICVAEIGERAGVAGAAGTVRGIDSPENVPVPVPFTAATL